MGRALRGWMDRTFGELARELRWSYLAPLMVYLAAGLPWVLKMSLGHRPGDRRGHDAPG